MFANAVQRGFNKFARQRFVTEAFRKALAPYNLSAAAERKILQAIYKDPAINAAMRNLISQGYTYEKARSLLMRAIPRIVQKLDVSVPLTPQLRAALEEARYFVTGVPTRAGTQTVRGFTQQTDAAIARHLREARLQQLVEKRLSEKQPFFTRIFGWFRRRKAPQAVSETAPAAQVKSVLLSKPQAVAAPARGRVPTRPVPLPEPQAVAASARGRIPTPRLSWAQQHPYLLAGIGAGVGTGLGVLGSELYRKYQQAQLPWYSPQHWFGATDEPIS